MDSYLKKRITLQNARNQFFTPLDYQPETVYHMTNRANLESILNSGKIHTGTDIVCWFVTDLKNFPIYIKLTGADHGRQYHDFDGRIHTAPPLDHAETVVLKLIPRYYEPLNWLKEVSNQNHPQMNDPRIKEICDMFDSCRICHYDDFKFKRDSVEIIELTDIDKMELAKVELSRIDVLRSRESA